MLAAYAGLTIAALFWAGNMLTGRALHDSVHPLTLACWRWLLILLVLLPFVAKRLYRQWPLIRVNLWRLGLLGLLSTGLFNALVFYSLHHTTATNAALLNSSIPLWTALLGVCFTRMRVSRRELAGLAVSSLGVLLIVAHGNLSALASLRINRGDALMLVGMVAWSVYSLLMPLRPKQLGPFTYLWVTGALGLPAVVLPALLLPAFGLAETGLFIPPASAEVWLGVVYLALFPSIAATGAYNFAIDRVGPLRAGQAVHLVPVFAATLAAWWLHEAIGWFHVVGFAAILGGLAWTSVSRRKPAHPGAARVGA